MTITKGLLASAVFGLIVLPGCGVRLGKMKASQRGEQLAIERGRVTELTNPVDKTRSYITISQLLLSFASDALRERDLTDVNGLLDQYVLAIQTARDTIAGSERDAVRDPAGYRDLETSLRQDLNSLQDISRQMFVEDRGSINRATTVATSIREQMARRLSGAQP
jgi:hypothetical protein